MNKAEREKLRELAIIAVDAVKNGNGLQISEAYAQLQREIYADKLLALLDHIDALEQRLFDCGEFVNAPCFLCGYNGPGYHQESQHSCVADIRRPINAALASAPEVKP